MPSAPKYTVRQVAAALRASAGLRSQAAKKLGCVPSTITNYISRHDKLKQLEGEIVDANLDMAEDALHGLIQERHPAAIFFYLKCKGKERGYIERGDVIPLESLRRLMEQLALVVTHNVKDANTVQRIEAGWRKIQV